jgi:hypothetical protein
LASRFSQSIRSSKSSSKIRRLPGRVANAGEKPNVFGAAGHDARPAPERRGRGAAADGGQGLPADAHLAWVGGAVLDAQQEIAGLALEACEDSIAADPFGSPL